MMNNLPKTIRYTNLQDFLFGNFDQVMITISPEKVEKAEEIFGKYDSKQILKRSVSHCAIPFGFVMDLDSEESNKVNLMYLVNKKDYRNLYKDLYENDIAGNSRHNPVLSRPYSFRRRFGVSNLKENIKTNFRVWLSELRNF